MRIYYCPLLAKGHEDWSSERGAGKGIYRSFVACCVLHAARCAAHCTYYFKWRSEPYVSSNGKVTASGVIWHEKLGDGEKVAKRRDGFDSVW